MPGRRGSEVQRCARRPRVRTDPDVSGDLGIVEVEAIARQIRRSQCCGDLGVATRARRAPARGYDAFCRASRAARVDVGLPPCDDGKVPSKPHDPSAPTVYLDQSTLCDALKSVFLGNHAVRPPQSPILTWLASVAREANLCISLAHVVEFARWPKSRVADCEAMTKWLDDLPLVWVHTSATIEHAEFDRAVLLAVGRDAPAVQPFAPALISLLTTLRPEDIGAALQRSTLPGIVAALRDLDDGGGRVMRQTAAMFREDRQEVAHLRWSEAQKTEKLAYRRRVFLRQQAVAACRRRANNVQIPLRLDEAAVQERLVEKAATDASLLPMHTVLSRFNDGLANAAVARQPNSQGDRDLESSIWDQWHAAVGAAYCDVFTCDRTTEMWLADARTALGRAPALSVGRARTPELFADLLRRTYEQAREARG